MVYLSGLIRAVADHHRIPVGLHLDHANDLDLVRSAIDHGFHIRHGGWFPTLPFAENVQLTRSAVELSHPAGISVEGELGHVGGMDLEATACAESVITEPDEVARFVEETDVDALAVSIGTSHGVYQSLPTLAIDRLQELNAASRVPLVLHGGSGTPEDQLQQAIRHGICKLNIYADCRIAMAKGLRQSATSLTREDPLPTEMFASMKNGIAEVVRSKINLLSAGNQAWEKDEA
jgi:ketose-bisphosphate aldolase